MSGFCFGWCGLRQEIKELGKEVKNMSTKLSELAAAIVAVNNGLDKAKTEILAKIAELEDSLQDVEIPAEAQAAIDDLRVKAQALDDIVPDAPPPA